MSNYPAQIDTSYLSIVVDNVTPISADIFNRLRSSILSVELALGINPAGVSSTVTQRLITIESTIGALSATLPNIDTIALLKSLANPTSPARISVKGYYNVGDGGGGDFYWDPLSTGTDNGGTIIQSDAGGTGRWKRIFEPGILKARWFGAKIDGIADDYVALSSAINVASPNNWTILIDGYTCLVGTTLVLPSNIILSGLGEHSTTLREHSSLGANSILNIGAVSPAPQIKNVSINNITIRNGTATTGTFTIGMNGVNVINTNNVSFEHVKITEIQGGQGIKVKFSNNFSFTDGYIHRVTYSGIAVLVECTNITILDSIFDTAVSTAYANTYLFATGAETTNEGTFYVKNVHVERCQFLNNPIWEGMDCHGGENIYFCNNYVENAHYGISVGLAIYSGPDTYLSDINGAVLKNVHIENNVIIQGTGTNAASGIIVSGTSGVEADQVFIKNNKIIGFGSINTNTSGAITVETVNNFEITGNEIDQYADCGIQLYTILRDGIINNNLIKDNRTSDYAIAIHLGSLGLYNIDIRNNLCDPTTVLKAPDAFIRSEINATSVQISDNKVILLRAGGFKYYDGFGGVLPINQATRPTTNFVGKQGDVIRNSDDQPTWYVSSPVLGFGSLDTTTNFIKATINASSKVAAITPYTGDYRHVPIGMNIHIAGAGASGDGYVLSARVIKNDVIASTITLDTAAVTSVVDGYVTLQALTLKNGHGNLPNNGIERFQIEGTTVGSTVIATALNTLTNGNNADALHTHSAVFSSQVVVSGLTTTGLTDGYFGYISSANTLTKTDATSITSSRVFGANEGTIGTMTVAAIIENALMTTAGGSPSNGAPVYLAPSTEEAGCAGKLTATKPVTAGQVVSEVGIVASNANYAGSKTAKILLQIKAPIQL